MLVSPGMDDSVRKSLVSQPVQVMPWIARTTCSSAADPFSGSEFDVYFPFRLSIRPPLSGVFPLHDPCEQHESSMGLLFAWTSQQPSDLQLETLTASTLALLSQQAPAAQQESSS